MSSDNLQWRETAKCVKPVKENKRSPIRSPRHKVLLWDLRWLSRGVIFSHCTPRMEKLLKSLRVMSVRVFLNKYRNCLTEQTPCAAHSLNKSVTCLCLEKVFYMQNNSWGRKLGTRRQYESESELVTGGGIVICECLQRQMGQKSTRRLLPESQS